MAKRLFIGTMLPSPSQARVTELRQSIEGTLSNWWDCKLRWVRPDKLHITLLFLGDCDEEKEAKILSTLDSMAGTLPATYLDYEQFEIFYSHRRPNAAVLLPSKVSPELLSIGKALKSQLAEFGQKQEEEYDFRPHLTLFRFPRDTHKRYKVEGDLDLGAHLPLRQEINQFSLIESHTGSQSADYIQIKNYTLV